MNDEQATSDLVVEASRMALAQANLTPNDIQLIIVATDTPDYLSPSTASVVQHKLAAMKAGTFDLNSACAGFVTALDMAAKSIRADPHYEHILVVGAYAMSKYLDWNDFKTASLFADGAGAVIVSRGDPKSHPGTGIQNAILRTDGQYFDYMGVYSGGTAPQFSDCPKSDHPILQFRKKIPIETNGILWPEMTHAVLDRIQKKPKDIDWLFFTQINIDSIHTACDRLGLPRQKAHNVMNKFGYTGSACIPMALSDATSEHKLKKGDLVVLLSSGGGMSAAAQALEWSYDT